MIKVQTPVMKLLLPLEGLEGDEKSLAKIHNGDILNQSINGVLTKEYINDAEKYFTFSDLLDAMQQGGEVYASNGYPFPCCVKIAETLINNEVPEGCPNREYPITYEENPEDLENPTVIPARTKTWNEWLLNISKKGAYGGYTATLVEEFWYYNTSGVYAGLQFMTGSELMLIHNSEDAELVDKAPEVEII